MKIKCTGVLLALSFWGPLPALAATVEHLKITLLSTMLADKGIGEWGFAALVEADGRKILVDTGYRTDTVAQNAEELAIDLSQVPTVVLTHFHDDHVGGLMTLRNALQQKDPTAVATVHVAKGIFYSRPDQQAGEANSMIALKPKFEATGGHFVEHDGFTEIAPGIWLTGPVPRRYPEHNWSDTLQVLTPAGLVEDTVPDDQSMIIETAKGLVIVAGCGHAGIVNILDSVKRHFGRRTVLAIIGGIHLFEATDRQLDWTAGYMKRAGVKFLIGAHCTGIEAVYRLRHRVGLSRKTAVVGAVGASFDLADGIHPGDIAH